MSYKMKVGMYLSASITAFIVGILFLLPCDSNQEYVCYGKYAQTIGSPAVLLFASTTLILLILFFSSQYTFKLWRKFYLLFLVVYILTMMLVPESCNAPLNICLDKQKAEITSLFLLFVISMGIIIWNKLFSKN